VKSLVSCDFETCLIRPALQAPPPVCLSQAEGDDAWIFPTSELDEAYRKLIRRAASGEIWLVGHNIAYDSAVALAWIDDVKDDLFAAYDRGAIIDTGLFERIAEIGQFTPRKMLSLDVVGAAYGIEVVKDPEIRLGYGRLYGEPLSAYSEGQRQYPLDDAFNTLTLLERQMKRHKRVNLEDVALLARKQFWLQLTRNWGMRIDTTRVEDLRKAAEESLAELRELAEETTIDLEVLKGKEKGQVKSFPLLRKDGTRDMRAIKAYVAAAYEGKPPLSPKGQDKVKDHSLSHTQAVTAGYISTNHVTLTESENYELKQFAEFGEWSAVLKKDVKMFETLTLEDGTEIARGFWPIHTKFGVADTTRSTSAKPNVQNPRKKEGIRECFVARPGHAIISVDHGGLELCTLAQVIVDLLGLRGMADRINAGVDLHCNVAKEMLGVSYEQALAWYRDEFCPEHDDASNKRNCGKVVNFGRAGLMGAETLCKYAKYSYKVDFSKIAEDGDALGFSKQLIRNWERATPEGVEYLQYIKRLPEDADGRTVVIPGTTIVRRGATAAAAANTGFQGLGAVLEAHVGWEITKAIHCGTGPLAKSGARIINFVHDEFLTEVPLRWVTECANQLEHIMSEAPKRYLPDVKIKSDAKAMMRWSKKAKRIVQNDELIPWDDRKAAA
jgi:hypothetical protein